MSNDKRHRELKEAADAALSRSARTAIERAKRKGTGVYVWEDGKVVNILAESKDDSVPADGETLSRVREEEPED